MIADDAHRHGGGTGSGTAASLAEVVAPCVLIGCADADAGQAVRPASTPSWWFYDVGDGASPEIDAADRQKTPAKKPKKQPETQTVMPAFMPPLATAVEPVAKVPESALATSEVLLARATDAATHALVIRAVEFLRARKGVASSAAFTAQLGEFTSRIYGLVAKLQEVLNVDGYQVLKFERVNQQVFLDVPKLVHQFELGQ
ncbi:MAG: hypothetical protein ACKV2T_20045 [Kofleriaceae bacterium]